MRTRTLLPALAALLLAAPLAAQGGMGMAKDKTDKMDHGAMGKMDHGQMTMKDHAMPAVAFTGVAPHTASGSYQIVVKDNEHFLKVGDDFRSTGAPDAFVYLAKDGKVDGSALELGQLASPNGGGAFPIPDMKRAAWYNTVVIWSKAHGAAVATAPLHGGMDHGQMMEHHDGMMQQHHQGMMMDHDSMMKHHDMMMKRDSGMTGKP
jgi:hypothetical protein